MTFSTMASRLAGAAAVAALLAVPAVAGGLAQPEVAPPVVAPAPVQVYSENVDWNGPWVGMGLGTTHLHSSGGLSGDDGAAYGLRAGYDYDFGTWVLGGKLSYDWTDVNPAPNVDLDSIVRLTARAGAEYNQWLFYGEVGPAWAKASTPGSSDYENGWTAGIGADYRMNQNWVIGGEVLFDQFDDVAGSNVDGRTTSAVINVSYRF